MTDKLVTLKEVKDYLKIDISGDKYNNILDLLNVNMTASVKMWLCRNIIQGFYSETFDIDSRQMSVFLDQYPVISIKEIKYGELILIENEDYYLYKNTGVVKIVHSDKIDMNHRGSRSIVKVSIDYEAGYPDIPESIKQATLKLIHREFYDRKNDSVEKFNKIGNATKLTDGMPMGVYTLLHPYRRQFR